MALKEKIRGYSFVQEKELLSEYKHESILDLEISCSELCFPLIYTSEEYFNLAYKIYDQFLEKLNIKSEITEKMIREVVVKHISEFSLPKVALKAEIADLIIDNLLYYGPISTISRIAGRDLNDVIVNTKDYIDRTIDTIVKVGGALGKVTKKFSN
jgi:hypothetical protein